VKPYAELLEFNQPNPVRKEGHTRIRDAFKGLEHWKSWESGISPANYLYQDPERIVEFAGRWDYGENNARKLGEMSVVPGVPKGGTAEWGEDGKVRVPIIQKYIDMGHESMLEMADATFFIECSRVVSHELVRHRLVSYQQESQRFVKYEDYSYFDWIDAMYFPDGVEQTKISPSDYRDDNAKQAMLRSFENSAAKYKVLRRAGVPPQLARYVLPNAMRTRMVMKTNLREWRHIINLRTDKAAQPEMRELVLQIHEQLVDIFPNVMYNAVKEERGVR
jgi:flavin-dependent thymidylate synthase